MPPSFFVLEGIEEGGQGYRATTSTRESLEQQRKLKGACTVCDRWKQTPCENWVGEYFRPASSWLLPDGLVLQDRLEAGVFDSPPSARQAQNACLAMEMRGTETKAFEF